MPINISEVIRAFIGVFIFMFGCASPDDDQIILYCAAGLKPAIDEITELYQKECGQQVVVQYGGSGSLLSAIKLSQKGDLYLPADESYIQLAKDEELIVKAFPLVKMIPVIAFRKEQKYRFKNIDDLIKGELKIGLANPEIASIGKQIKDIYSQEGKWDALSKKITVYKPTVNDLANDLIIGSVDIAFLWDAVAKQYHDLEYLSMLEMKMYDKSVEIASLSISENKSEANAFLRFLTKDKVREIFESNGYTLATRVSE